MKDFRIDTAAYGSRLDPEELAYTRWLAGLVDGLVSPDTRADNDCQMLLHTRVRPVLFAAFVSGVVSDLLSSPPAEDPWRRTTLVEGTVRSLRGESFGSWVDGTDLLVRGHPDLRFDSSLAALASPLTRSAALLIHLCARSWSAACDTLREAIRGGITADELFSDGCAAIRWALHRRRAYTGADDPYTTLVTMEWVRRANSVENDQPWDEARRARLAMQEKVGDGVYEWLTAR